MNKSISHIKQKEVMMLSNFKTSRRHFLQQAGFGLLTIGLPGIFAIDKIGAQQIFAGNVTTEFNRDFARLLLEICRYTYGISFPNDAVESKDAADALSFINLQSKPEKIVRLDDGKGKDSTSVACVVSYPDRNIVAYMGTKTEFHAVNNARQSIHDWARNTQFIKTDFIMTQKQLGLGNSNKIIELGGRVHEGFLKELSAIQEKIVAELEKNGGRKRPLYITGHSQGGAEAALAVRALLAGDFDVRAAYTFAAPRPGNQEVADTVANIPIYRIEFGNDIVPHVPTTLLSDKIGEGIESFVEKFDRELEIINEIRAKHHFVGIGRLCYGNNDTKTLRINISPSEEKKLLKGRIKNLINNPNDWGEHHHLAGTTREISKGMKGNYTALVSEFDLISG